jgi:hypothetical protein
MVSWIEASASLRYCFAILINLEIADVAGTYRTASHTSTRSERDPALNAGRRTPA